MVYYKTMADIERALRGPNPDFPRGKDIGLKVLLDDLKREDVTQHEGVMTPIRIMLSRFYDIFPYFQAEDVRVGNSVEFMNRILNSMGARIDVLFGQSSSPDIRHLLVKETQLTIRLLDSAAVDPRDELDSAVDPVISPLTELNGIERRALRDLSIGAASGNKEFSVKAAERFVRDASVYFPPDRIPEKQNDVGDDFIHFLLLADYSHPRVAERPLMRKQG